MRDIEAGERRKFLMGLVAGTGAVLVAEGCNTPDPAALINKAPLDKVDINALDLKQFKADQLEVKLSDEAKTLIARKNIVNLTKVDVAGDLLRRLNIARAAAPQDEAGKALVVQIDEIIAKIQHGNKLFGDMPTCW